jgi:transcriptional antiterminator NusG
VQEEAKWYVLHTYAGHENKVASNIEKFIRTEALNGVVKEVKVPSVMVVEIKNGKKKEIEQKLFPNYVFIKMEMNDDVWYALKNIRGVTDFVGRKALTDEEIDKFKEKGSKTLIELNFDQGDSVVVTGGALEGYEGLVESINYDKGIAKVLVNMFGRKTSVEIEFKNLVPI